MAARNDATAANTLDPTRKRRTTNTARAAGAHRPVRTERSGERWVQPAVFGGRTMRGTDPYLIARPQPLGMAHGRSPHAGASAARWSGPAAAGERRDIATAAWSGCKRGNNAATAPSRLHLVTLRSRRGQARLRGVRHLAHYVPESTGSAAGVRTTPRLKRESALACYNEMPVKV